MLARASVRLNTGVINIIRSGGEQTIVVRKARRDSTDRGRLHNMAVILSRRLHVFIGTSELLVVGVFSYLHVVILRVN